MCIFGRGSKKTLPGERNVKFFPKEVLSVCPLLYLHIFAGTSS